MSEIRRNFLYPEIKETDYVFGAGQVVSKILRSDGDWRPYLPPGEIQRRNGVESSACFVEASQHAIATILEEEFDIPDQNFSARFNLIYSNASPQGGDPLKAAQSFRDKGLIPDTLLPFADYITSWEEFRSFEGGDRTLCEKQGKVWRSIWEPNYDIVFKREDSLENKYSKLRIALRSSPVPLSVYGVDDGVTYVPKPKGVSDTHLVEAVYVDDKNCIYVWDTYPPFLKKLPANYNPDFAMRWSLEKNTTKQQISIIEKLLELLKKLLGLVEAETPKPEPKPSPEPIPSEPKPLLEQFCLAIKEFEGFYPGSRSFRNNNPGNCKYSPVGYDTKYGVVKKDAHGFAIFSTYDLGWLYLNNFVKSKAIQSPNQTIFQFIASVYAPASDKNDPVKYAEFIAKKLGITVDYKLKVLV